MTTPTPTPSARTKRQTQLITRAMIRKLRERVAANPPRWMRAAVDAADSSAAQMETDPNADPNYQVD